MRGQGEGNLINILRLSPWQGAARHREGGVYVSGRSVASLLWPCVSLALGPGRVQGWDRCSEIDQKDGNSGSAWLNDRDIRVGMGLPAQEAVSRLWLTLLDL